MNVLVNSLISSTTAMLHHLLLGSLFLSLTAATPFLDYNNLPNETIFPGPWEEYIKAPSNKSYIRPARIWKARGNVSDSGFEASLQAADHDSGSSILIGMGGILTLEFDENIAGRCALPGFCAVVHF